MPQLPPHAYHLVEERNWAAVQREGLLSARSLLLANALPPTLTWRPHAVWLPDGRIVRDQRPMPPAALARCLDQGLTPQDWYDLLNSCVFLWLDVARLHRHALAMRGRPQVLLRLDAAALAAALGERCAVSAFNLGSAMRRPARRGIRSLVPVPRWTQDAWRAEALPGQTPRRPAHRPAEMVIRGDLPNAAEFVTRIVAPTDLPSFLRDLA